MSINWNQRQAVQNDKLKHSEFFFILVHAVSGKKELQIMGSYGYRHKSPDNVFKWGMVTMILYIPQGVVFSLVCAVIEVVLGL